MIAFFLLENKKSQSTRFTKQTLSLSTKTLYIVLAVLSPVLSASMVYWMKYLYIICVLNSSSIPHGR